MSRMMIEEIKVGVSKGGVACGPVSGNVVAEVRIRDMEEGTVTFHALSEVAGTLNFTATSESTYDIQIRDDADEEEAWEQVQEGYVGGYDSYEDFYADLEKHETCTEAMAPVWKYLAYLVRADWDAIDHMKTISTGKCLGDFELPVCDAEQEYLNNHTDA